MPIFQVRKRIDAYADYVADVRARTAKQAARLADENEELYDWEPAGTCEFDARIFITLDADGFEIEDTEITCT